MSGKNCSLWMIEPEVGWHEVGCALMISLWLAYFTNRSQSEKDTNKKKVREKNLSKEIKWKT